MGELISFGIPSSSSGVWASAGRLGAVLTRRLDRSVTIVPASSYTELSDNLAEGRVDFAWLPPLEAVQLTDYTGVTLLLQLSRLAGGDYHSVIFVRDDSEARTLEDIRGKRVAFVHRRSASGFIFAAAHLVEQGVEVETPALFRGSHGAVVKAVADGEVIAGATFGVVKEDEGGLSVEAAGWQQFPPSRPKPMRVIAYSGPVPPDAICAWPGTTRAVRRLVVEALMEASRDTKDAAVLEEVFGASDFVVPTPSRYELLNVALSTIRRARREEASE